MKGVAALTSLHDVDVITAKYIRVKAEILNFQLHCISHVTI